MFDPALCEALKEDNRSLAQVLARCPEWDPATDAKLGALLNLVGRKHSKDKVLVFTQFADTARYLCEALKQRGIGQVAGVTGAASDPTVYARRFSPQSSDARIAPDDEIRVLIATDVLSEGQNLQDAHIVVSYDLPWAIIRLIQRAGRVDRIGQMADTIHCYSFWPADGVDKVIHLRNRLRQRLKENAEVVGTDERFFDDDHNNKAVAELYSEKAGSLDDDEGEVDLASRAYEIWDNATSGNPGLRKAVESLPDVVHSTKYAPAPSAPDESGGEDTGGVLVYLRTSADHHALAWIGPDGQSVSHSALRVLEAAACEANTPALPRAAEHYDLVESGVRTIVKERRYVGGQLGKPSGARYRAYQRLRDYASEVAGTLLEHAFEPGELQRVIEDIYRYPLTETARDSINRQLRARIGNEALAEMVVSLRREGKLCQVTADDGPEEATVLCSMGLRRRGNS
jgi:hypothetical protein